MKKRKILFIVAGCIFALLLIVLVIFLLVLNSANKNKIVVNNLEQMSPLSEGNSVKATEMMKANTVKVVNKLDDDTSIIGTGFFDKSGYLVTNSHIVDIKGSITVVTADGKKLNADLYSNDIETDIALLAVENNILKAVYYGKSLSVNITDDVYAIGYPLAFEGEASVSKGVLSARRSAGGIEFLQSDISLNSGNSGGPLINDKGELLGINTFATENASIGMSISSESLQIIISKLLDLKKVSYLEGERPKNHLNVVLNEIGYKYDDVYNEQQYLNKYVHGKKNNTDSKSNESDNNVDSEKDSSKTHEKTSSKSSNAYLQSLSITNYNIPFDSYNFDYSITLTNNENSLDINAIPIDQSASVTINNNNLNEGYNIVSIVVKAENGTINEYKINVVKPFTYLDGISGILCCMDTQKYNGVNSLVVSGCDFVDSDGIRIYANGPMDIIQSVKLDVYAGWNGGNTSGLDTNGKPIRYLKTFTFGATDSYGMPLSELRSLLNDSDYEGGVYNGADLTVYITLNTRRQGTFYSSMPWGLNK